MAKISIYPLDGDPKLSDKLIGTSVGYNQSGELFDPTYNFSLQQLLDLFLPNIPTNNLQGVLDYGNTATQDINLFGKITTTDLEVTNVSNLVKVYVSEELYIEGLLFDKLNSSGTLDQVLTSTADGIKWVTLPPIFTPNLQQVLAIGNMADIDIILNADIESNSITTDVVTCNNELYVRGELYDWTDSAGVSGQILVTLGDKVEWQDFPLYTATSPLSINPATKTISIQVANSTQNGYLSFSDWISFDGKQDALSGTGIVVSSGGTISYITNNSTNWNQAYNDTIVSAAVTGTTSKTLTLTQRDGDTITANWSDPDTGLTSVGVSMPSAFSVANSPLTSNGTIVITGAGTSSQLVGADGSIISAGTGISISGGTISSTVVGGVTSFNTRTGAVTLTSSDVNSALILGDTLTFGTSSKNVTFNNSLLTTNKTYYLPDNSGTIALVGGSGVGTVTSVAALTLGTTGTDLSSTVANSTTTPVITLNVPTASATNRGALSAADWTTFNNKQASGSYITSLTGEATASGPGSAAVTLSTPAVTGKLLTGVNITGGTVLATDSMLTAFGKLQNQINSLISGSAYQGVWNASTNTPTLTSSVGTNGYYYVVNVAGNTNLNGITDWNVGDWAIFHDLTWQKVDNTDSVSSVNGQTGAVSLTTDNIPEGTTNLYYLNSRARAALSFTAGSGAYNSTTGVITIPTNTSQLANGANYITLSSLSAISPLGYDNTTGVFTINSAGASSSGYLSSTDWNTFNNKQTGLNGTGFVKISGTTISYDNTSYLPLTGGTLTGALSGTTASFSQSSIQTTLSAYNGKVGGEGLSSSAANGIAAYLVNNSNTYPVLNLIGLQNTNLIQGKNSSDVLTFNVSSTGNVTANSFIKSGGTSSQYLMADGSVSTLSSPVTGSGTTNYLPKFTGSSAIGNSQITDNGTSVIVGGSGTSTYKFYVAESGTSLIGASVGMSNASSSQTAFKINHFGTGNLIEAAGATALTSFSISNTGGGYFSDNVGIGTASPNSILEISQASPIFRIQASDSATFHGIEFRQGAGFDAFIKQLPSTGEFRISNGRSVGWGGFTSFYTDTAERMRITSGGNVGIGTTSPSDKLTISDSLPFISVIGTSVGGTGVFGYKIKDGSGNQVVDFSYNSATGENKIGGLQSYVFPTFYSGGSERMRITSSGNVGIGTSSPSTICHLYKASFPILTIQSSSYQSSLGIDTTSGNLVLNNESNASLSFNTNATERMRITSSGNVLLGTTDTGFNARQLIRFDASGTSTNGLAIWNGGGSGAVYVAFANSGGGFTGTITQNSTGVSYNTTSDYRLKEDLKSIKGLELISKIKVYDFKWKNENSRMDGVIAHELQEVIPYAVTGEKDGKQMQQVDYSKLVPILVQAIQELKAEIEILKNK